MALSPQQQALLKRRLQLNHSAPAASSTEPAWSADPANRYLPFPLTDVQYAYWLGRMASFELGKVGSHGYQEWVYDDLDLLRYEAAWNALVARHDMLRAVVEADGQQRIQAQVPTLRIVNVDCRHYDQAQAWQARLELRNKLSHRCYDPAQWPSFSLYALLLPQGKVVLHISADALFGDVYSAQILRRELKQLYDAPNQPLPPLVFSFRDYVMWQQSLEQTSAFEQARRWWQAKVADMAPAPALPWNPNLPAEPRFERLTLRLDAKRWEKLQGEGRRHGLSPSCLLLAAYAWVLRRWSGDSRFTLNLTLFNRVPVHRDVAGLMGDFTQTLLFDCRLSAQESFAEAAQRIQQDFAADFDHRLYSGVRVLRDYRAAHPERHSGGQGALMPVVFTSAVGAGELRAGKDESWRAFGRTEYEITQTPQVLLDHQVFESDGMLVVQWDVVPQAFPEGLLQDLFGAYDELLQSLAEHPGRWVERGPLVLPAAQQQVRDKVNSTCRELPSQALHAALMARADEAPNAPALFYQDSCWSYGQLWQWVLRIATALGPCPTGSEYIGVLLPRGPLQIAAVIAVSLAGAAYVPLDPTWPAMRQARVLSRAGVRRVLVGEEGADLPVGIQALSIGSGLAPASPAWQAPSIDLAAPAYAIFTSGSTGEPKGVVISHRAACNTLADMTQGLALGAKDRILGLSALSFDLSVFDIFGVLGAGGALVLPDTGRERDVEHWRELIVRHRVTLWNSVPALLELLLAQPCTLDSLRLAMLSGDWISQSLVLNMLEHHPQVALYSLGGATEAAIWSVIYRIEGLQPGWHSIPYGKPLANQRLYVLDDQGDDAPDWVAGDLYIAGCGLADGYLNDPERTTTAFIHDARRGETLYRTGDRARYRPDGNLEFLGRIDSQVKLSGYRIELGEIEAAMCAMPGVTQALAIVSGSGRQRRLLGYVCGEVDLAALRTQLQATLPSYMIPSHVQALAQLPLSANGKVDRARLPLPEADRSEHIGGHLRASERRLLTLLSEELGQPVNDLDANLFDLGATSLNVVNLHQRLVRECCPELPLMTLFRRTCLRELAAELEGEGGRDTGKERAHERAAMRAERTGRRGLQRIAREDRR